MPILFSSFLTEKPGSVSSTIKAEMRRERDSGSVTAKQVMRFAREPLVVHFFSPCSSQPPSFLVPITERPPASEPANFSESANAHEDSPFATLGRYFLFCSSVPPTMIGMEPSALTAKATPNDGSAFENSSTINARARMPSSVPPYSFGIQTPSMPASQAAANASSLKLSSLSCLSAFGSRCSMAISLALAFQASCASVNIMSCKSLMVADSTLAGGIRVS